METVIELVLFSIYSEELCQDRACKTFMWLLQESSDSLSLMIRGMSRHGDCSLLDFHRMSRRDVAILISLVTGHGGRFQPELNFNLSLLDEQ